MQAAGKYLLELQEKRCFSGTWEGTQYKAYADKMMHDYIAKSLKEEFPSIAVVSEEAPDLRCEYHFDRYFLIDPIDGTASFAQGFLGFVSQLAYIVDGKVQCAVVVAPALKELYTAEINCGSYLNGNRIFISTLAESVLIDNYPSPTGVTKYIFDALQFDRYIECGSIGLKSCKVACSEATAFIKNVPVKEWDVAPADLIVHEAGGVMRDATGSVFSYGFEQDIDGVIVASNLEQCMEYASILSQW